MSVTRVALGPLKIFSSAPVGTPLPREPGEGTFLGSIARLPFVILASALVVASIALACGVAFDLPGLIASGRVDPNLARDIQHDLHTAQWPRFFRAGGGAAMFVLAFVASVILMLARRHKGGIHMARVLAGVTLLLWAPFILAGSGVTWNPAQPWARPDWSIAVDDFLGRIDTIHALRAAVVFVAGVLLLLWPARVRSTRQITEDRKPSSPPTAPGAAN